MTGVSCAGPREQRELRLGRRVFRPEQLLVMAIVNRTPDSFYRPGVTWDPAAALDRVHAVVAEGAGIVCSHAGGQRPRTRPFRVAYDDVVRDVLRGTLGLAARALEAGVAQDRILIDPAHDFGKNTWHSLEITRRLAELAATGWPVLAGAMRGLAPAVEVLYCDDPFGVSYLVACLRPGTRPDDGPDDGDTRSWPVRG